MNKYIILLFLVLLSAQLFGQELKILSSPYFKETINDIKFIDTSTGWVCLNKGLIYKTTDGGQNWFEQNSGTTKNLVKISTVNQNIVWTVATDGYVYKTTDGGATWTEHNYGAAVPWITFAICDLVKFFDENIGFIFGGTFTGTTKRIYMLKSSDGGITWSKKDSLVSTTTRKWYDIDFYGSNGVVVGDKKDIQKYTTDFGETWTFSTPINDNFFRDLKYVKYLSPTVVITIGEGNEFSGVPVPVYKSTDGGVNWQKKNQSLITVYDRVKGAYFKNSLEGIGVGNDGFSKAFVVKTTDGGETWTPSVLDYAFGFNALTGVGDFLFALGGGSYSHLVYSTDFGETWQILPKKAYSYIAGINFISGKGYAVTRNGDVYISNDGTGNEWEYLSQAGKNLTGDICFLPNNAGFLLKENHHIVKSTNSGQTWETVLTPVNPYSRNLVGGIDFGDLNTGYAWFSQNDYGNYYVYKTSDGGNNWSEIKYFDGPGYISGRLVAFDADNVVLLGPDLWTQRTTDGGITWNPAVLNNFSSWLNNKDFKDVAKIDEDRAVAVGEKFICITTDKGATWNYVNHGITDPDSIFYRVAFSADTLGYVVLYNGSIIKTTDFGSTWSKNETYVSQYYFFSVALNESGKLFLGTSTGHILGEETITGINDLINVNNFYIEQNYPNPFNPETIIKYSLSSEQHISLKVFDFLGNEIATLVNDSKRPGIHHVKFNASEYNLASGIYLYQIRTEKFFQTKKMMFLK